MPAVGDSLLDRCLERAPRDVHRARDRALFVLVGLAHVEEQVPVIDEPSAFVDIDFGDVGFGGPEEIPERGHTSG